jgi:flagellar biogenesis protein FliO
MPTVNQLVLCAALLPGPPPEGSGPVFVPDGRVEVQLAPAPDGAEVARQGAAGAGDAGPAANERLPLGPPPPAAKATEEPEGARSSFDPRGSELIRVGGALGAVLVLIVLLRGVLRAGGRLAGGRPPGVLEVLGRYPVGRGQSLVLLKLGTRLVLVHQTRAGMSAISEVSEPQEVAALLGRVEVGGRSRAAGFHGLLARVARRAPAEAFPLVAAGPGAGGERVVVDLTRRRRRAQG